MPLIFKGKNTGFVPPSGSLGIVPCVALLYVRYFALQIRQWNPVSLILPEKCSGFYVQQ